MVPPTQRNRELIADFATQRPAIVIVETINHRQRTGTLTSTKALGQLLERRPPGGARSRGAFYRTSTAPFRCALPKPYPGAAAILVDKFDAGAPENSLDRCNRCGVTDISARFNI
jgi:hypothetical protein